MATALSNLQRSMGKAIEAKTLAEQRCLQIDQQSSALRRLRREWNARLGAALRLIGQLADQIEQERAKKRKSRVA